MINATCSELVGAFRALKTLEVQKEYAKFWSRRLMNVEVSNLIKLTKTWHKDYNKHWENIRKIDDEKAARIAAVEKWYRDSRAAEDEAHNRARLDCEKILNEACKAFSAKWNVELARSSSYRYTNYNDGEGIRSTCVSLNDFGFSKDDVIRFGDSDRQYLTIRDIEIERIKNTVDGGMKIDADLVQKAVDGMHELSNDLLVVMMANEGDRDAINKVLQNIGKAKGDIHRRIKLYGGEVDPQTPCALR